MKTALVGLGPHGQRLLKSISEIERLSLVGVVDKSEEVLKNVKPDLDIGRYTDLPSLFAAHPDLEVLVICTNGPSHASISLAAMENGVRYLFVSKPLACTLTDAQKIVVKAAETSTRIVVDHGLRHDPSYNWIKIQQASNAFGKLKSIYIQRPGIGLGCLGVHSFDLANFLVGDSPQKVSGWVDAPIKTNPRGEQFVDPGGLVILEYQRGIRATIVQNEDGAGPMSVEINYQFARIRVDEKFGMLEVVAKDQNFQPSPGKSAQVVKTLNPQGFEVKHDIFYLMRNLLEELISDKPMKSDAAHGLRSVEILVAAYMSHEKGNISVVLPLVDETYLHRFLPVT